MKWYRKMYSFIQKYKKIVFIFLIISVIAIPVTTLVYYFRMVNTDYLNGLNVNLDSSFSTLNTSRWRVPSFQEQNFLFEIENGGSPSLQANTTYSVNYYDMGTTDHFKANRTQWGEWGYAFHRFEWGSTWGPPPAHYGGYPSKPTSKREAYEYMMEYVVDRTSRINNNLRPWMSFNGHYPYHHYAAEYGFDEIGSEIGENMESYQMILAFNRGAARQYQLPWFLDFSAWYGPGLTEFNDPLIWQEYGGVNNGHSMSMFRRSYFMSYMSGTSRLIAEGGHNNLFFVRQFNENGLMPLTPLGEIGREIAHFAKNHTDRGIPYTPVALYLDEYHGTMGFNRIKKTFDTFRLSRGDKMTYELLDILFPGGWDDRLREKCQLVNNEYGDIFDVILQNATAETLSSYPVILMSGEIYLDDVERSRLIDYVRDGGTVIANSAYLDSLNSDLIGRGSSQLLNIRLGEQPKVVRYAEEGYGEGGNFILYGNDYNPNLLQPILRELLHHLSPFSLSSSGPIGSKQGGWGSPVHIQSMINRNSNGWVLTLINNDGVTKKHHDPPEIKFNQRKFVTIKLNNRFLNNQMENQSLVKVSNWVDDSVLWENICFCPPPGEFTVVIEAGDLAVLHFEFQ